MEIREVSKDDIEDILEIYLEGISSGISTFQTNAPTSEEWDQEHLADCRFVAINSKNLVVGWIALTPVSGRCVYRGVAEISVYIKEKYRAKGIGTLLLAEVISKSEDLGIWTLQSGIIEENQASISLHKKNGFRIIGYRELIGQDKDGIWRNVVLMERRSTKTGMI